MTLAKGTSLLSVNILKDFSSETKGPVSILFHMEPPNKRGRVESLYIGPSHMTKMAAMSIYDIFYDNFKFAPLGF